LLDVWVVPAGAACPTSYSAAVGRRHILRRMGRRYDAAFYTDLVARVRRAIPGAAVHADVIAGFPGEDDAAWDRTAAFLRRLDLAGVHVFRYSMPARDACGPNGRAGGRTGEEAAFGRGAVDRGGGPGAFRGAASRPRAAVLFEQPLLDGRWLGHAESHVLVAAAPAPAAGGESLANAIGLVRADP